MGGKPVGYLQSAAKELNSGQPTTNPANGRVEGLNPGPPDYKSSALITRPRYLRTVCILQTVACNLQSVNKVLSDSQGLVDFSVRLVHFIHHLPDGQVKFLVGR